MSCYVPVLPRDMKRCRLLCQKCLSSFKINFDIFIEKNSRRWQFSKRAECGRFRFPATRCNLSSIFWRLSRSDRSRSNYIKLVPGDTPIVIHRAQDTIDSGCEMAAEGTLSAEFSSRVLGQTRTHLENFQTATHPHTNASPHPKIFFPALWLDETVVRIQAGFNAVRINTCLSSRDDSSRTYSSVECYRMRNAAENLFSPFIHLPHIALIKSLFINQINWQMGKPWPNIAERPRWGLPITVRNVINNFDRNFGQHGAWDLCLPRTSDQDTHQGINSVYTVDGGRTTILRSRRTHLGLRYRPFREGKAISPVARKARSVK